MNTIKNTTTGVAAIARTIVVAAAIGAATFTVSSCGEEVRPPAQDVGVEVPEPEVKRYEPACNTPAAVRPCPANPPGDSTRNRMQFDDEFEPGR